MNKLKKYFYDWKSNETYGGGHYVLNEKRLKFVTLIVSLKILLILFYFGTTVIFDGVELDEKISGLYGIGVIVIMTGISLLIASIVNWILNKFIR